MTGLSASCVIWTPREIDNDLMERDREEEKRTKFFELLLSARVYTSFFLQGHLFTLLEDLTMHMRKLMLQKLHDLPRVAQQVSGRVKIQPQAHLIPKHKHGTS